MLKILEVSTLFPRWKGDQRGPIIYSIALHLSKLGHKVTVINMHGPGSKFIEEIEGIRIIRPRYAWPEKLEILQNTGGGLPAAWEKKPFSRLLFPLLLLSQFFSIIKISKDTDIIHTHFTLSAMAATLGKPIHKKPIVVTVRGSDIYRIPLIPFGRSFNKLALSGASKITVMSHDLANALINLGVQKNKIEYIPPPIEKEKFPMGSWEQRENKIVFIGSLIKRKGPDVLLDAYSLISNQFPNYKLFVVGYGPLEDELKEKARKLKH